MTSPMQPELPSDAPHRGGPGVVGGAVRGDGGGTRVKPSRGVLLVRPIESAERFAGGAIIVPADARERLTANQYEVVAVGAFAACDDEDCERPHERVVCDVCYVQENFDELSDAFIACGCEHFVHPHAVRVGDWILVRARSAVAGPDPERAELFVHQDAVLGIFNIN